MKHFKLFLTALLCLLMQSATLSAKEKVIKVSQLPAAARTFVAQKFPKLTILSAKKDLDGKMDYEVKLSDGTNIDFDEQGNWDMIDCKRRAVPAEVVPKAITSYMKKNYPKAIILKIEKETYGYEIDISKGPDLRFDKKGAFIGIDR